MNILRKRNILKLAATLMLVAMMAGTFAMHTKAAFATTPPCGPSGPSGDIAAGGNCNLTVSANDPGLWFNNDATVSVGTVNIGVNANPFTFATTVIDSRTTPTGGWRLQAVSPGLVSGTNNIPLTIGDTGSTCIILTVPCIGFTATSITLPDTPLESTPQTFAAETSADGNGTYTLSTAGNFTVADTTPGGAYSATITLSLLDTFGG